jgi:hypothetical protein
MLSERRTLDGNATETRFETNVVADRCLCEKRTHPATRSPLRRSSAFWQIRRQLAFSNLAVFGRYTECTNGESRLPTVRRAGGSSTSRARLHCLSPERAALSSSTRPSPSCTAKVSQPSTLFDLMRPAGRRQSNGVPWTRLRNVHTSLGPGLGDVQPLFASPCRPSFRGKRSDETGSTRATAHKRSELFSESSTCAVHGTRTR